MIDPRVPSLLGIIVLCCASSGGTKAASFVHNWTADFSQPLNSTTKDWNIYNNGPVNGLGCWIAGNISISGSVLRLEANTTPNGCARPYSVAGLDTWHYHAQNYGRWIVRAKFPAGYGVDGFFGLFPADGSWPPEIDFGEAIGRLPNLVVFTQHFGTSSAHSQTPYGYSRPGVTWSAGFHWFELRWVPGWIYFYVDGGLVHTQQQRFRSPAGGMKLGIGIVAGDCGSWIDCPMNAAAQGFPTPLPTSIEIRDVKIYKYQP